MPAKFTMPPEAFKAAVKWYASLVDNFAAIGRFARFLLAIESCGDGYFEFESGHWVIEITDRSVFATKRSPRNGRIEETETIWEAGA